MGKLVWKALVIMNSSDGHWKLDCTSSHNSQLNFQPAEWSLQCFNQLGSVILLVLTYLFLECMSINALY